MVGSKAPSGPQAVQRDTGHWLTQAWQRRGLVARLLLPATLLYCALVLLRRALYRFGWLPSRGVACPVLVVGNAIAGGAGKTPTTIAIVQHFVRQGLAVGVVSRGYGRNSQAVLSVIPTSDARAVGDEPLLIARATQVPVFVARKRHAAAEALLRAHPQTQLIVCDDGLQHFALHRDLEVCVFDDRATGNGWLLPSGPLREPWPRASLQAVGQSDANLLVLHTGRNPAFGGFTAERSLSTQALTQSGQALALESVRAPVLALAGIARPESFFSLLRERGVALDKTLALPDHFDFTGFDIQQLAGHQVLCTEKDAVKLWTHWPAALAVPLIQTLEPAFLMALDSALQRSMAAKLSSRDGHQTA